MLQGAPHATAGRPSKSSGRRSSTSGMAYAAEGGIRGPGPSNQNETQAMRDQGYTPNTHQRRRLLDTEHLVRPVGADPERDRRRQRRAALRPRRQGLGRPDVVEARRRRSWQDVGRAARDYPALEAASTVTKTVHRPRRQPRSFLGEVGAQYVPGPVRTWRPGTTRRRAPGPGARTCRPSSVVEETFRQRSGVGRETVASGPGHPR